MCLHAAKSTVTKAMDQAPTPPAPAPPQDAKKAADTGVGARVLHPRRMSPVPFDAVCDPVPRSRNFSSAPSYLAAGIKTCFQCTVADMLPCLPARSWVSSEDGSRQGARAPCSCPAIVFAAGAQGRCA